MKSAINWFEVPANDFDRARKFYEAVLGTELPVETSGRMPMAFFPVDCGIGGAIVRHEQIRPGGDGTVISPVDCLVRFRRERQRCFSKLLVFGELHAWSGYAPVRHLLHERQDAARQIAESV